MASWEYFQVIACILIYALILQYEKVGCRHVVTLWKLLVVICLHAVQSIEIEEVLIWVWTGKQGLFPIHHCIWDITAAFVLPPECFNRALFFKIAGVSSSFSSEPSWTSLSHAAWDNETAIFRTFVLGKTWANILASTVVRAWQCVGWGISLTPIRAKKSVHLIRHKLALIMFPNMLKSNLDLTINGN